VNRLDRLIEIARRDDRRIIGLMSGTSLDGIDVALVHLSGHERHTRIVEPVIFETYPFPVEVQRKIRVILEQKQASLPDICHLDFVLGELFAAAVNRLIVSTGTPRDAIDLIATAGQTIWHDPKPFSEEISVDWMESEIQTRSTFALGQSAVIAERTGIITIGDLRVRDVATGGQGAPLVPYADWVLLRHPTKARCVQNIGGIGNVTYLPPNAELDEVIAFDTGPGNMIIDEVTEVVTNGELRYDVDGALAASGSVDERLLAELMSDQYFDMKPPKTTGRERFASKRYSDKIRGEARDMKREDLVATVTAFTAESIARSYRDWILPLGPVDEIILGGGGAFNPTLVRMLRERLPTARVIRHEELELDPPIDSSAKEAIALAIIANDSVWGLGTNIPGATGGRPTVLGKINL
jgi:anhydro-N-acetylmuramic acid kinase